MGTGGGGGGPSRALHAQSKKKYEIPPPTAPQQGHASVAGVDPPGDGAGAAAGGAAHPLRRRLPLLSRAAAHAAADFWVRLQDFASMGLPTGWDAPAGPFPPFFVFSLAAFSTRRPNYPTNTRNA
jgi:hypothetical protein